MVKLDDQAKVSPTRAIVAKVGDGGDVTELYDNMIRNESPYPDCCLTILVVAERGNGKTALEVITAQMFLDACEWRVVCVYRSRDLYHKLCIFSPWEAAGRICYADTIEQIPNNAFIMVDEMGLILSAYHAIHGDVVAFSEALKVFRQKNCAFWGCCQDMRVAAAIKDQFNVTIVKMLTENYIRSHKHEDALLERYGFRLSKMKPWVGTCRAEYQIGQAGDLREYYFTGIMTHFLADYVDWWDEQISRNKQDASMSNQRDQAANIIEELEPVMDQMIAKYGAKVIAKPSVSDRILKGFIITNFHDNFTFILKHFSDKLMPVAACKAYDVWQAEKIAQQSHNANVPSSGLLYPDGRQMFGDFVYNFFSSQNIAYFEKVDPDVEWGIISKGVDGQSQDGAKDEYHIAKGTVSNVWNFYWAKSKKKKMTSLAPRGHQLWWLYELWNCAWEGADHNGQKSECDEILPDGRAASDKIYSEHRGSIDLSIRKDCGPEYRWAKQHEQASFRLHFRNIQWVDKRWDYIYDIPTEFDDHIVIAADKGIDGLDPVDFTPAPDAGQCDALLEELNEDLADFAGVPDLPAGGIPGGPAEDDSPCVED